ncbi:hypothetical protein Tco_0144031 [Tanacetum coccineum]
MKKEKNIENNKVADKNVIELSELNAIKPNEVVDMKKEGEDKIDDEPVKSITEDVLIKIASYIYPVDFMIVDIKEDEKKPFILGTPFEIRFDKGTITLKFGNNKIDFFKIPEFSCKIKEETEDNIDPITPTNIISRQILEWEERINLHQEKEMRFNQWRSKAFDDKCSMLVNEGCDMSTEGGVT